MHTFLHVIHFVKHTPSHAIHLLTYTSSRVIKLVMLTSSHGIYYAMFIPSYVIHLVMLTSSHAIHSTMHTPNICHSRSHTFPKPFIESCTLPQTLDSPLHPKSLAPSFFLLLPSFLPTVPPNSPSSFMQGNPSI